MFLSTIKSLTRNRVSQKKTQSRKAIPMETNASRHILTAIMWAAVIFGLLNLAGCDAEEAPEISDGLNHVPNCADVLEVGSELDPVACPGYRDVGMCQQFRPTSDRPEWVQVRCWYTPAIDRLFTCVPSCDKI